MADEQDRPLEPDEAEAAAGPARETPVGRPAVVSLGARVRRPWPRWLRLGLAGVTVAALAVLLWVWWPVAPRLLLTTSAARLASARGVEGDCRMSLDFGGEASGFGLTGEAKWAWQPSGRMRLELRAVGQKLVRAWNDGSRMTFELVPAKVAVQCPTPRTIKDLGNLDTMAGGDHLQRLLTTAKNGRPRLDPAKVKVEWVAADQDPWLKSLPQVPRSKVVRISVDGLPCYVWIDRWTHLPQRVAWRFADLAKWIPDLAEMPSGSEAMAGLFNPMKLRAYCDFRHLRLKGDLPVSTFQPALAREVKLIPANSYAEALDELQGSLMPGTRRWVGKPAPDFTAADLQGHPVTLSSLRGRPVVVDFFATWCPYSVKLAPTLDEVQRRFKSQGLQVVVVSVDQRKETLTQYLASNPASFAVWWLDAKSPMHDRIEQAYHPWASIPRTVYIAADGTVKADQLGWEPKAAVLRSLAKLGLDVRAAR